jgi:lysophospholipase L1-like esterase
MTRTVEDIMRFRRQLRRRAQIGRASASLMAAMRPLTLEAQRMGDAIIKARRAMDALAAEGTPYAPEATRPSRKVSSDA